MDAKRFLNEFRLIIGAPGGLQNLRRMIYHLAITGNLTEQLASDGNASALLEELQSFKSELIGEGIFRRSPKLENQPAIYPSNVRIPETWVWSRLVDIGEINPRNELDDTTLVSLVTMEDIPQGHMGVVQSEQYSWRQVKQGFTHLADDDVVIAKITPSFENGKSAVVSGLINGFGAGTTELHVVRPLKMFVEPAYIYIFLKSPYFTVSGENSMVGTAGQKRLPVEYFATRAFPLPPRAEQERIIVRVNELMALCDKLELQEQERVALHRSAHSLTLQALENAKNARQLQDAWKRAQAVFHLLFNDLGSVKTLKDTIFRLATQGKLTIQRQTEVQEVEKFLQAVEDKRNDLIGKGFVEPEVPLGAIKESELPFPLPAGWLWCRLQQVSICRDAQRIPVARTERERRRGEYDYYGASGKIDTIDSYIFDEPLLLVGEDGANLVNRSTPIAFVATGKYWVNNHAHVLDSADYTALKYLCIYINAIDLTPYITGSAQPKMNQQKMNSIVVAMPPPEEQERIVRMVDKLMTLCDNLSGQLASVTAEANAFAVSSIGAVIGINIEEGELVKPPKIEIISSLRIGVMPTNKAQAPLAAILVRNNGELPARTLWNTSGLGIEDFYQQLKLEMAKGWVVQPQMPYVRDVEE